MFEISLVGPVWEVDNIVVLLVVLVVAEFLLLVGVTVHKGERTVGLGLISHLMII